jgi:hypothetical protein
MWKIRKTLSVQRLMWRLRRPKCFAASAAVAAKPRLAGQRPSEGRVVELSVGRSARALLTIAYTLATALLLAADVEQN